MPRPASGSIDEIPRKDGVIVYYLRVRWHGQRVRVRLGTDVGGWSRDRAQVELDRTLAQIARGTWTPPGPAKAPTLPPAVETFHVLASRWWNRREQELAAKTREDYLWRINHLLLHVSQVPVGEFDTRAVDELRAGLQQRGLGPRSTNMVLGLLAQILEDAVESGALASNPARGRRRRVREPGKRRSFLEPDMVVDMLDVAGEWEASLPAHQRYGRRALLALLALGGLRIGEALTATVGALDLHAGRLRVADSKTEAGLRDVELTWFLLGELRGHVAGLRDRRSGALLFPSSRGRPLNASNIRRRLLGTVVERANEKRENEGRVPLPATTPHSLRRTFVSLCFFEGRDPRFVMQQVGHADARLTLAVYAQAMSRRTVDRGLVHDLMRFVDESEDAPVDVRSRTTFAP